MDDEKAVTETGMISKLRKYYRNERFTYWFLSLLPFVFLAEVFVYLRETSGRDMSIDMVFRFLIAICVITGLGLVIYQIVSNVKFYKNLKQLPEEMQETVKNEIPGTTKRGRYLLTKDVLVYFGMFNKKVFKRNEISRWKRDKGIHTQIAPKAGRISVPYDNTIIYFTNGHGYMDKIEYPVDPLESKEKTNGELPCTSVLVVFVSIVFTLSMIFYPRFLSSAAPKNEIERYLFYSSYEVEFFLRAIVITAVSALVAFIIRCFIKPIHFKDKLTRRNRITVAAILLVVAAMFIAGAIGSWYQDAARAREDYKSYKAGDICVVEGTYKELGACGRNEVGWTEYEYAERHSFRPVLLSKPGSRLILLRSAFEELPEEGKKYRIEYLEKTKIVVSFTEIQD